MLPLVSTRIATESGTDVLRSNTAISCGTLLSSTRKSCLPRLVSKAPEVSRTETSSLTRFTLTEKTGGASANGEVEKIWGFSRTDVLHWMGANDFSPLDALDALERLGVTEVRKDVIARDLRDGRKGKGKLANLSPEQEDQLLDSYRIFERTAAAQAAAKLFERRGLLALLMN